LEEDRFIAEQAEVVLTKATVKIGVISDQHPTWLWHIGPIGQVQWNRSPTQPMGGLEQDPPWIGSSGREQSLLEVEAILVQGNWPPPEDQVWRLGTLTVTVRIQMKQRRRRKKLRLTLPEGWLEKHKYVLFHHEVGGVTN
jgi:hypothetical protein